MTYEVTTQQVMDRISEEYGDLKAPPCPFDNVPDWEWREGWSDAWEKKGDEPTEDEILHEIDAARERRSNESPWLDYEPAEDCA